jgi:hypothetical protein
MDLRSDEVVPTGPLFKFLSLSAHQTPTWQDRFTQLIGGKAYLSSPGQFNDPFDCLPTVTFPNDLDEFHAKKHLILPPFQKAMPNISSQFIEDLLTEAFTSAPSEEVRNVAVASVRKTASKTGVFCLAECISSVLMWSHYASNHTGIALRFDWRRQLRGGLMPLLKVRYSDSRPMVMGLTGEDGNENAIADALRVKADFWKYEQEWRFIEPNGAGTLVSFNPDVIDSVILGVNCSEADEAWIRKAVAHRSLTVLRAVAAADTFELSFGHYVTDQAI